MKVGYHFLEVTILLSELRNNFLYSNKKIQDQSFDFVIIPAVCVSLVVAW